MKTIIVASRFASIEAPRAREKLANYLEAVLRSQAKPVVISSETPHVDSFIEAADGLLLTGGGDIPGHFWGSSSECPYDPVTEKRAAFEIPLIQKMHELQKPILGICLGSQMINVAFGGTLIEDLNQPGQAETHQKRKDGLSNTHPVLIQSPSRLSTIFSPRLIVNSRHHQAIKESAQKFRVSAISEDNVIEAIERDDHPWLVGVQWHPEDMLDHPEQALLFKKFIEAC